MDITGRVDEMGTEVYIKSGSTDNAITLKDFTTEFKISAQAARQGKHLQNQ